MIFRDISSPSDPLFHDVLPAAQLRYKTALLSPERVFWYLNGSSRRPLLLQLWQQPSFPRHELQHDHRIWQPAFVVANKALVDEDIPGPLADEQVRFDLRH
jgi:hypothetical protein